MFHHQNMDEPVRQTSPLPVESGEVLLDFPQAIREVIAGKKVTKLEWNNKNTYISIKEGFLMIFIDGKISRLILQEADLVGKDWVVINEVN